MISVSLALLCVLKPYTGTSACSTSFNHFSVFFKVSKSKASVQSKLVFPQALSPQIANINDLIVFVAAIFELNKEVLFMSVGLYFVIT